MYTVPGKNGPCSNTRGMPCDSDCLCQLISKDCSITSETDPQNNTLDVEEIYQVLGRDILKSSLLDDIELYLECEEDNSYHVPRTDQPGGREFILPQLPPGSKSRFKVTFPCPPPIEEPQRHLCTICQKTFTKVSLLKNHQAKKHNIQDLFQCPYCSYKGLLNSHLQKHIKRKHVLQEVTAKEEKYVSGNKNANMNTYGIPKLATYEVRKTIATPSNLVCATMKKTETGSTHMRSESNVGFNYEDFPSDVDRIQGTTAKAERDCHVEIFKMPPTKSVSVCELCRKSFKSASAFNEHEVQVHGPKTYICPDNDCKKAFSAKRRLKAHFASHTSSFVCNWPECGRTFRDGYNLEIHRKSHKGIKDINCTLCDYVCIQRNSLKWHMSKKHGCD